MVPCHHGEQTAGPGRGGGSPRRGGRTPAPGRPLELLGAVPPPDRPSTDAWLRAVQQRGVPCRPMPSLQRGGGHTTACAASVPGAGGETPAAPGHNKPGGDRGQGRRRGGGLGRRLPRPTEPTRLRPVTGPGGTTTTTTTTASWAGLASHRAAELVTGPIASLGGRSLGLRYSIRLCRRP